MFGGLRWSSTINLLIKDVTSIGYVGQQIDTSHIRIDNKYKYRSVSAHGVDQESNVLMLLSNRLG